MERISRAKTLYQVVMDEILGQIESGVLKTNDRLPSESELCRIHSVGRNTIRRAIQELASLNVLQTIAGVGTFVLDSRLDKTAEYLFGFTQEMQFRGHQVKSQVIKSEIIPADSFLARRLQLQLGEEVFFLYRIRLMDGDPTAIERSYLPYRLCPQIDNFDFSSTSLYDVLSSQYDKKPDHAEQVIEARLATPDVARLLGLQPPAAVFVFHRETRLANGQVIEYVESELRGDRFRFMTSLRLQSLRNANTFLRLPQPLEADYHGGMMVRPELASYE